MTPKAFQTAIFQFYKEKGRKTLPWQKNKNCYRVWVSEVMLQQTQVATVIPYFERFMKTFPTVEALAKSSQEDVLALWTGLGYYSRARNLHKAAIVITNEKNGIWPTTVSELEELPGIGRSTAGAILSLALNQQATILDGNVKRVLCRFYEVNGWPGKSKVHQQLWEIADKLTPGKNVANYNQAMMDLGATLCTRRNPECTECPLSKHCLSFKNNRQHDFPNKKPKTIKPIRETSLTILISGEQVLLEKRPQKGIWGGLWSLPESQYIEDTILRHYQRSNICSQTLSSFRHTFSHFHLDITPLKVTLEQPPRVIMDNKALKWQDLKHLNKLGLPAPVLKLLNQWSSL